MDEYDMAVAPEWNPTSDTSSEEGQDEGKGTDIVDAPGGDDTKDVPKPEGEADKGTPPKDAPAPTDDKKPVDPPTRKKTPMDYILARKQRQAERDKAIADGKDPDDSDPNHGIAPEDLELMSKAMEIKHGDTLEYIERQRFAQEIETEFQKLPFASEFTPAEKAKFIEYAQHPAYAEVGYEQLAVSSLGYERLIQMGADKERKASAKAAGSKIGGGQGTGGGDKTPKDWSKMSMEEFAIENAKVFN